MAKILVIGKYYVPFRGGIEENTRDVAELLARRHQVEALVFNHEPGFREDTIEGVRIRRFPAKVYKSQPISLRILPAILRTPADVVLFHAPNVWSSIALLLRMRFGRRPALIITHHMDMFGRPVLRAGARWLYRRLMRHTDRLLVTSLKNATISADIPEEDKRRLAIVDVPLGIDPADYAVSEEQRDEAASWRRSIAGDAPVVGFVGRHARYKGLDVLVRALAELPGVHALIAGDGPYRAPAEALAGELGLADRVHFIGFLTHAEKLRLLAAIDVFAFPSTEITEAFGVSQLEAMAVGAPIVASNLPTGVTDVAVDNETALLVPPGDVGALAATLGRLLVDPVLRRALGERAGAAFRRRFTRDIATTRAVAVIEDVLSDRDRKPRAGMDQVLEPT